MVGRPPSALAGRTKRPRLLGRGRARRMQSPSAVRARRAEESAMQTMNITGTRAAISAKRLDGLSLVPVAGRSASASPKCCRSARWSAVPPGTVDARTGVQSGVEPMTRIRAPSTAIDVTRLRLAKD